jgi:hypothetical protein
LVRGKSTGVIPSIHDLEFIGSNQLPRVPEKNKMAKKSQLILLHNYKKNYPSLARGFLVELCPIQIQINDGFSCWCKFGEIKNLEVKNK